MPKGNNASVFDVNQVTKNKFDPLIHSENSEGARRELFQRYSQASTGFGQRDVSYAAANLIINSIRQKCRTANEAETAYDELVANLKRSLLDLCYFPSGQRRAVFPFDQVIEPDLVKAKQKWSGQNG